MKRRLMVGVRMALVVLFMQGCWAQSLSETNAVTEKSSTNAAPPENEGASTSGRYQLIKDGNKELCELNPLLCHKPIDLCTHLEKNFNSFKNEPPMVCERKFNEKLGFTTPDWKPIKREDISWEILKQIYFSKHTRPGKKPNVSGLENSWVEEKVRLEKLVEKQTILWSAEFDIDNKEGQEKVLMLRDNDCSISKYYAYNSPDPSLHVLDSSVKNLSKSHDRLNGYSFDVFKYKNHTYLSAWKGLEFKNSGAQIFIYHVQNSQNKINFFSRYGCTYQYIQ